MTLQVTITNITGQSPYDVSICQPNGTGCFYISTIDVDDIPYVFNIPEPYNVYGSYMLKITDSLNCTITGVENVVSCP